MAACVLLVLSACERQDTTKEKTVTEPVAPKETVKTLAEEPEAVPPKEPVVEEPQEPVAEKPEKPIVKEPVEPVAEEPKEPAAVEPEEPAEERDPAEVMVETAIAVKLALADKLDGTEDKIIERCVSCKLLMDGKEEHALEMYGYTFYFCSEKCSQSFAEKSKEVIMALKIPGD
ncbi:MAG: hypothetical protein ABIG44_14150 [Planctomycetota bacterium]